MAKKANIVSAPVMPMADVVKLTQKEAVNLYGDKTRTAGRLFIECAKIMVHIRATIKTGQTVYGLLKAQGVCESTIANGAQAERVYSDLVTPGHLTEAQFDKLGYRDCVAINAVSKARGKEFVKLNPLEEIHHVHEFRVTRAEKQAADKLAAAKPAEPAEAPEKAKTEPAKTVTSPKPAIEEKPAKPLIEEKRPDNLIELAKPGKTLADGERLIAALEETFIELSDDDASALYPKFFALSDMIVAHEQSLRMKRLSAQKAA